MQPLIEAGIIPATEEDIPALLLLLNSAYRGEESKKGWTSEAHLISGNVRTTAAVLKELIQQPGSVLLKYVNGENEIAGCVNLQQQGDTVYLGMLSVNPVMQGGGIGKKLLAASEVHAKQAGCKSIYMTVIALREELVNWYIRHGYVDTGKRKVLEEDGVSGGHLQNLEMLVLEKKL